MSSKDPQFASVHTEAPPETETIGIWFGLILQICSWIIIVVTFPVSMCFCLKVIKEYERVVIFRLGRLVEGGARGPGMIFILPCVDTYRKIDLRLVLCKDVFYMRIFLT